MKTLVKIIISICLILCVAVPSWSETKLDIENKIIEACEAKYTQKGKLYYCMLSELYALNVIVSYYMDYRGTEHIGVFNEIWDNNFDRKFEVYNYVIIEKGIRAYLESVE